MSRAEYNFGKVLLKVISAEVITYGSICQSRGSGKAG